MMWICRRPSSFSGLLQLVLHVNFRFGVLLLPVQVCNKSATSRIKWSLVFSAMPPIVTDVTERGLSLRMSVTLVQTAKAIRQNEMLFGRDTHVAQSITLYYKGAVRRSINLANFCGHGLVS